jgi:hypothetical protein
LRLAAQVLQFLHRALDGFLGQAAELLRRLAQRPGADLEADGQRARRREHLRLAHVQHRARCIAHAFLVHRRHAPDGADAPVREHLFEVQRVRIDLDVAGGFRFRGHAEFYLSGHQPAGLVILESPHDFFARVHHERPVGEHRFPDRLSRKKQDPQFFFRNYL